MTEDQLRTIFCALFLFMVVPTIWVLYLISLIFGLIR